MILWVAVGVQGIFELLQQPMKDIMTAVCDSDSEYCGIVTKVPFCEEKQCGWKLNSSGYMNFRERWKIV